MKVSVDVKLFCNCGAGANENSFNTKDKIFGMAQEKIKLVTHHWSSNPMKGWIDYKKVDEILNDLK